jgi:Fungal protein kinase
LVLVDTHANQDAQRDNLAPDISVYAPDNVPDADTKTDFSKMELFVELKFAESSDPFRDPKDPRQPQADHFRFENDSEVPRLNRGQLCSYTAAHAGSQFRVHTFTLLICGRSARFIRWDRSGATVTRSFDYIKDPHILASFFWRYANLNHSQRGYDTSLSPVSPEDLQQIQHVETCLRNENPSHREFRIIMVPDRDVPKVETRFIISFPPKYTARSPFGRATRPMLAFNMETREIVFLKDYWRADVDGVEKEGEIYALLEAKGVPNIAPFGKGNDVRHHKTLTHTLRNETWACWSRVMVLLSQYRMSLDVVARLLTSFKSSREFVSAIADAMTGTTSSADSDRKTNFSLPQHINMPISTRMSFIVTSAQVIS